MMEMNDEEIRKTPLSVHGKVLTVLNEWEGWADKVDFLPCVKK